MATKARDINRKKSVVDEIKNKLEGSPTVAVVRYSKVSSNAMNDLRTNLEKANGTIKIYKNTLASLAFDERYPELKELLILNNAFVFSNDDGLETLKTLKNFKKENKSFEIVGGVFDYKLSSIDQLDTLAGLPNKDGLLSMLLSTMQAKITSLLWGLKEVALKKENK